MTLSGKWGAHTLHISRTSCTKNTHKTHTVVAQNTHTSCTTNTHTNARSQESRRRRVCVQLHTRSLDRIFNFLVPCVSITLKTLWWHNWLWNNWLSSFAKQKKINHFKWGSAIRRQSLRRITLLSTALRYNRTITTQKRRDYSADEIGQILTTNSDKSQPYNQTNPDNPKKGASCDSIS